jgi:hypothetical protein
LVTAEHTLRANRLVVEEAIRAMHFRTARTCQRDAAFRLLTEPLEDELQASLQTRVTEIRCLSRNDAVDSVPRFEK